MTTNLDDRVRVLMARLGDATPMAPTFESLTARPVPVVAAPTSRPRWAPLAAAAAVVALIVGAIAIYQSRDTSPATLGTPTTRQVATDLPDGWSLVRAVGPGTQTADGMPPTMDMMLYATDRAPLGPVIGLTAGQYGFSGREFSNTMSTTLADGRRVSLSDVQGDSRWADVEVTPGTWVGLESRGVEEASLLTLAATITLDTNGTPTFAVDAVTAAGLSPVGSGQTFMMPFIYSPDSGSGQLPLDITASRYRVPTETAEIEIVTFTPTTYTRAWLALFTGLSAADDGSGLVGLLPRSGTLVGFYAERDGLAFYATGPRDGVDATRRIIDSMRPVSEAEWQRLVDRNPVEQHTGDTTVETTGPPDTTAPAEQPSSSTLDFAVTVEPGTVAGEYVIVQTAPDGTTHRITATYSGRTIRVATEGPDGLGVMIDVNQCGGIDISTSVVLGLIVTCFRDDNPFTRVRAVADGTEYLVDLVQPDPTYPVKLGLLLFTPGQNLTVSALDADGTVTNIG